jgi:hypothetical protein
VSSAFTVGPGTAPPLNSTEVFVSPTVTVTVAAGQRVFVSASVSLEDIQGPGGVDYDLLEFWIAYQPQGGTITNAAGAVQYESLQGQEINLTSLSAVLSGLAPGMYQVGLAASFRGGSGNASISAEGGSASALVFQSP